MDSKEVKTLREFQLPDELIEEMRHDQEVTDAKRWKQGDIVIELVDEFGEQYGKMNVRKRIAVEVGVAASTIRDREGMSRFFGPDLRDEFEVLSYSQLRACKPAGVKDWRDLAKWAVESADDFGGRPAPADAITAKRLGPKEVDEDGEEVPWASWELKFMRQYDSMDDLLEDADTPAEVKDAASRFKRETVAIYRELEKAKKEADDE